MSMIEYSAWQGGKAVGWVATATAVLAAIDRDAALAIAGAVVAFLATTAAPAAIRIYLDARAAKRKADAADLEEMAEILKGHSGEIQLSIEQINELRDLIVGLADELRKTKQVVKDTAADVAANKPDGVVVITPGVST